MHILNQVSPFCISVVEKNDVRSLFPKGVSVKSFNFIFNLTSLSVFFYFKTFPVVYLNTVIQVDLSPETFIIHFICVILLTNSSSINSSFHKSSPTNITFYWLYSKTQ